MCVLIFPVVLCSSQDPENEKEVRRGWPDFCAVPDMVYVKCFYFPKKKDARGSAISTPDAKFVNSIYFTPIYARRNFTLILLQSSV